MSMFWGRHFETHRRAAAAAELRAAEAALTDDESATYVPRPERTIGGPREAKFGKAVDKFVAHWVSRRQIKPGGAISVLIDLAAGMAVMTGVPAIQFLHRCCEIYRAEAEARNKPFKEVWVHSSQPPLYAVGTFGALNASDAPCDECGAMPWSPSCWDTDCRHVNGCSVGKALIKRWGVHAEKK